MIIAIILLWINIILYSEKNKLSAYLKAVTAWTLYMFFITEILSFVKRLDFTSLIIAWSVLDLLLLVNVLRMKVCLRDACEKVFTGIRCSFKWSYMILAFISLVSLFFAIKIPPYNWDSMTYHLSRVAHWAGNKSVGHYSTNIVRQIASPVLTEFVVLQTYIMCKENDIFVNVIQSSAFITNTLIIYGITKKLNCNPRFSFLASFLYMTMPIAFAESTTTQVDNFAAIWMLIFAYFIIDFVKLDKKMQYDKETVKTVIVLGSCISLGYLCKPSVSISMLVFAVWLLIICIVRKDKIANLIKLAAQALPWMLIPIGLEIGRNIYTFGKIIAPLTGEEILIGTWKPSYVFINFVKNITHNLPNIYIVGSEQKISNFVCKLALKLNVEINDPSISFGGCEFNVPSARTYNIDTAINPIIVILTLLCIILIICSISIKRKKLSEVSSGFSIISILAFFIFCMVFRWQPWGTRLMISYLALLCVTIGVQLQSIETNGKYRDLSYMVIGIVYFCSFVELCGLINYYRTIYVNSCLVSKEESYFIHRHDEYEDYVFAANFIKEHGYKNIGFFCGEDNYEYPLIKMLEPDVERFEHIEIMDSELLKYEDDSFIPDCIIAVGQSVLDTIIYHDTEYYIAYDYGGKGKYIIIHE